MVIVTALMAEDLDQERIRDKERERGDVDDQNAPEITEEDNLIPITDEDQFSKLKEIQLSFSYWRFQ